MTDFTGSVDADEIRRFSDMAQTWWDPDGPMKPLHRLMPARLRFLRQALLDHAGRGGEDARPLQGLRILDIGCGGGLVSEPLTRLGATVTGVDAAEKNIAVARAHAQAGGLEIDYRHGTAEALVEAGERFDAVLALEIVEHVADLGLFVEALSQLVRPGGLVVFSTLNRTPKAWALAIAGAEYVMRWLPRGTHTYAKFVRPSELAARCRAADLRVTGLTGLVYSPLAGWSLSKTDLDVNYFATAVR